MMMRIGLLLFFAILAGPAFAAKFEFRGIKTSDTSAMHLDEFMPALPGFPVCNVGTPQAATGISARKFENCYLKEKAISGVVINPSFLFNPGGQMVSMEGRFDEEYLNLIREVFVQKYGKPSSIVDESYVAVLGNKISVMRITWKFDDGLLTITQDQRLDEYSAHHPKIDFETPEYKAYWKEIFDAKTVKPKVDF